MPRITMLGGSSSSGFRPTVDDAAPTYTLQVPAMVNKNSSFWANISTTGVADGVQIPYSISGPTATSSGVFVINSNMANVSITTIESLTTETRPITVSLLGKSVSASLDCFPSRIIPTVETSGNVTLNWNYYVTSLGEPDRFEVYVDGTLRANVNTSVASFSISSGADRTLLIKPRRGASYTGADITRTVRYFDHTAASQSWTVPTGCQYLMVDVLGAQGGSGGAGGRTRTLLEVTAGETLYMYVGGLGANAASVSCSATNPGNNAGGFNGGGSGGYVTDSYGCPAPNVSYIRGPGGGGASDIRRGGTALANRILVSGGGGGGAYPGANNISSTQVGHGAGYNSVPTDGGAAGQPYWSADVRGYAATSTAGGAGGPGAVSNGGAGSLGQGGNAANGSVYGNAPGGASGGGGGYYGGGAGGANSNYGSAGSGGGGSGYLSPVMAGLFAQYGTSAAGYNTGHGKIFVITQ